MRAQPRFIEAVRLKLALRVICNRDGVKTAPLSLSDNLIDRHRTVRCARVAVQFCANVRSLNHTSTLSTRGKSLDLTSILARGRWNPIKPKRRVHLFLTCSGNRRGALRHLTTLVLAKESVFVEPHALRDRSFPHANVVVFAAREIHQCSTKAIKRHHTQIHLHA